MITNDNVVKHRMPFKRGGKIVNKHYPIRIKSKYKEKHYGKNKNNPRSAER